MNKTKIILAAMGGVIAVAVLAAAAFVYLQLSAKTAALEGDDEGNDGLETMIEKAEDLSRKSVYPSTEGVKALNDSREQIEAWREDAFKLAAHGDRPIVPTTPPLFKEFLISEAHRLGQLKGDGTNTLFAADFTFGPFKPYVAEGSMPEAAELPSLQRKFDDAVTIFETLAKAGVTTILRMDLKDGAAKPAEEEAAPKKGKSSAKGRKNAKAQETATFKPASHTYEIVCKMRPAPFVKALNLFATSERFTTVDSFTFALERDAITAALGGATDKKEAAQSGGRRRRRQVVEETPAEGAEGDKPKVTVVTDPETDAMMDVTFVITVHDFKSLEEVKEEEESK